DETKGNPIGKSVCLKPKMYSVLPAGHDPKTPDDPDSEDPKKKHSIQKAKGVKKCVVKRELWHDRFLEYLRNKKLTWHDMYGLHSYNHQIYLGKVNKIELNPYDNKHWILLDGIQTLPYGYWRIELYKHLIASEISPEKAEERAMKARLRVKA
ncbi:78_t:CDS:1, partial [Gigaspora margarita]